MGYLMIVLYVDFFVILRRDPFIKMRLRLLGVDRLFEEEEEGGLIASNNRSNMSSGTTEASLSEGLTYSVFRFGCLEMRLSPIGTTFPSNAPPETTPPPVSELNNSVIGRPPLNKNSLVPSPF
jgi:hypothetical protein